VQPRFSEAREDFLYHLKDDQGRKDDTLRAYWSDLDDLLWWADERGKDVLQLTGDDIRRYLALQRRRGYSQSTIRRRLTTFRAFYGYLVATGVILKAPTEGLVVRKPRRRETIATPAAERNSP
jgi:site-specific recombinase XerD